MADANSKEDSPQDPTPVILTPGSSIDSGWRDFCQKHESWLTRFAQTNPLYRLPSMVISSLTSSKRLDAKAAQAERDLAKLCRSSDVVGFLNGRPINYRLLFGPMPKGLGSVTRTMDQLPAQHPLREQLDKLALKIFELTQGYAGWLLTEPAFDNDIEALKQQSSDFCVQNTIQFPLLRTSFLSGNLPKGLPELITPQGRKFAPAFVAFCDRWALTGMASWELPEPQPLLLLSPPLQERPHVPSNVLHIILPAYYPLVRSADLIREICRRHEDLAKQANIHPGIAQLSHFKFFAQLLVVFHLERVITSRYGPANGPPGFVGHLKLAITKACGVKADQVDRYRKAISARRRGQHNCIPKFRPRS